MKLMQRKYFDYLYLWLTAAILNLAWEHWHAQWYVNYRGQAITDLILLRASLVDATMILAVAVLVRQFVWFRNKIAWSVASYILIAVALEYWALSTDRWQYGAGMIILPLLNVGLTPAIQLAITGCLAQKLIFRNK